MIQKKTHVAETEAVFHDILVNRIAKWNSLRQIDEQTMLKSFRLMLRYT